MNEYPHATMIYAILSRISLRSSQSSSLVLLACQILLLPSFERFGTLRQMPLKKEAKNGNQKITSFLDYNYGRQAKFNFKTTAEAIYICKVSLEWIMINMIRYLSKVSCSLKYNLFFLRGGERIVALVVVKK